MKKTFLSVAIAAALSMNSFAGSFVVKDIKVNGVNPQEQQNIINSLKQNIGYKFTDAHLAELTKAFYKTNRFRNVEVSHQGSTLIVNVLPQHVIRTFKLQGINTISKKAVLDSFKQAGISPGQALNPQALNQVIEEMNAYYASVGNKTKVEAKISETDMDGVDVIIAPKGVEADTVRISKIHFDGNHVFKDSTLKGVLASSEKGSIFFWKGKFNLEQAKMDADLLRRYYARKGYPKVEISEPQVADITDPKQNLVDLTYHIKEGDRYKVSGVTVVGNTLNKKAEIESHFKKIKIGKYFNGDQVEYVAEKIKSIIGDLGYIEPNIQIGMNDDPVNKTVEINYMVDPGYQFNINSITFTGNTRTKENVLRRELPQMEGTVASLTKIEDGNIKLLQSGNFEDSEYHIKPSQRPGFVDVEYAVKEARTGSFQFGIGHSSDSGINYKISVADQNFAGTGNEVSLSAQKSKDTTSISLDTTKPYITDNGIAWVNSISYSSYKADNDNKKTTKYTQKQFNVETGLSIPITKRISGYAGIGFTKMKITGLEHEFFRDLYLESINKKDGDKINIKDVSLVGRLTYNSLNKGFFPTEGTYASVGGRLTTFASTNKYFSLSADNSTYYPLNADHSYVLNFKMDMGYMGGIGKKRVPFYKLTSGGGIDSIRGFDYGSIGPYAVAYNDHGKLASSENIVGGNVYANAKLALIVPTPFVSESNKNYVRTSIFLDVGNVWSSKWKDDKKKLKAYSQSTLKAADWAKLEQSNKASNFRAAVGVSFEWRSPVGPLVFSYAVPVKKKKFDTKDKFQFSIGGTF